jgi:hypothetical protein
MMALAGLRQVESFEIDGTGADSAITDAGLAVLHGFVHLRRLALRNCPEITAEGWAAVAELEHLRCLTLSISPSQSLDGALAAFKTTSMLEELSLERGMLTDEGLKNLAVLKHLRHLDLGWTHGYTVERVKHLVKGLPHLESVGFSL